MKKKKEKTLFDKIKLDFKKITLSAIILNILFLIFGVVIYMNPYITASAVGIVIGIYFMLFGIFAIYEYFMRNESPLYKNKIFMGILTIILGIFIVANPFNLIKILTFTLGIYLIVIAITKAFETFKLKKYGYDGWPLVLVTTIILLIFGVFVTINPLISMDIIQVTGIFIILSSILEISNLIMIYGKAKELVKLFKNAK